MSPACLQHVSTICLYPTWDTGARTFVSFPVVSESPSDRPRGSFTTATKVRARLASMLSLEINHYLRPLVCPGILVLPSMLAKGRQRHAERTMYVHSKCKKKMISRSVPKRRAMCYRSSFSLSLVNPPFHCATAGGRTRVGRCSQVDPYYGFDLSLLDHLVNSALL
jgi:hypothetical protein